MYIYIQVNLSLPPEEKKQNKKKTHTHKKTGTPQLVYDTCNRKLKYFQKKHTQACFQNFTIHTCTIDIHILNYL